MGDPRSTIGERRTGYATNQDHVRLHLGFSNFYECILGCSAHRAGPGVRYFFKRGTGTNTAIGISDSGVIDPVANRAFPFIHEYPPLVAEQLDSHY